MPGGLLQVTPASTPEQYKAFQCLTLQYLQALGEDLSFQHVDLELAALIGSGEQTSCYASPHGTVLLAEESPGTTAGAVAVRPLKDAAAGVGGFKAPVCEMKRLFVVPGYQGRGVGRALTDAAIAAARRMGYQTMVLDTLTRLTNANNLYRSLGFQPCQPYYHNPLPDVLFWAKDLR